MPLREVVCLKAVRPAKFSSKLHFQKVSIELKYIYSGMDSIHGPLIPFNHATTITYFNFVLNRHHAHPDADSITDRRSDTVSGGYTSYEFQSLEDWLEYCWKKCFLSKKFIWTGFETTVESPTIPNGGGGGDLNPQP